MILYLSSPIHENLIERLEVGFVKNKIGSFDIERFFREEMVRLENIRTIIIDIHCIDNSEESFFAALEAFLSYAKIRLIIYAEELERHLLERLLNIGVYNIVISKTFSDFSGKMKRAIEVGYTREEAYKEHLNIKEEKNNSNKKRFAFLGNGIEIAVYGIKHGTGTTAFCLNLATYLSNENAKVIVCGINEDELQDIAIYYNLKLKDNKIEVQEGFTIYSREYALTEEIMKHNNFIIADMGVVTDNVYKAKKTIVTTYSKEADIVEIEKFLEAKESVDSFVMRSTEEGKKDKIQKRLKGTKLYFSGDMPGYFGNENQEIFFELCSDFMIEK